MRFPLSLTTTMIGYIARKKLSGTKRFPLVLMLEPLHACNLTCTGCGRIREYSSSIKEKLSVKECLDSVDEAGAPIVSICGGEPMIYPEIGALFAYLTRLGVDGFMLSPAYGYVAVHETNPQGAAEIFLTRDQIRAKFKEAEKLLQKYRLASSPIYLEFLAGKRELTCTAWGNPTRNVKGWKGPCYLITDQHHDTFDGLMNDTDWSRYGYGKDPRCEHCMVHCGYEPS